LGGALRPQVSLNGKVLMEERPPSSVKAVVAELLPLTHSIRKKDDLQFRICRKPDLNLENQILISLWDKEAIERDCQMKSNLGPMFQDRDFTREMQKKFQFNSLSVCAEARVLTVGPKK